MDEPDEAEVDDAEVSVPIDEDNLVHAVRQLTVAVEGLKGLVGGALTREEARLVYSTKAQSKQRRTRAVAIVLVTVLIALLLTMGAMFSSMNYCFFTGDGENGRGFTREGVCNLIPGYDATQAQILDNRDQVTEAQAKLAATAQQNAITNAKQDAQLAAIETALRKIEQKLGIPQ